MIFFTWSLSTFLPTIDCEEFYPVTSISSTVQERIIFQSFDKSKVFWKGNNKLKLPLEEIIKQIKFIDCFLQLCSESFTLACAVWRCMNAVQMFRIFHVRVCCLKMYECSADVQNLSRSYVLSEDVWMQCRCSESFTFICAVWTCMNAVQMLRIFHVHVCCLNLYECSADVQNLSRLHHGDIVVVGGRGGDCWLVERLLASECGLCSMALIWKVRSIM